MFVRLGDSYVNASQIKRITPADKPGERAEVQMIDGSVEDHFISAERMDALTQHIFPAPPGYENLVWLGDEPELLRREAILAFAFEPGDPDQLTPLTAESGWVPSAAVKTPSGEVLTYFERFKTEEAYVASMKTDKK